MYDSFKLNHTSIYGQKLLFSALYCMRLPPYDISADVHVFNFNETQLYELKFNKRFTINRIKRVRFYTTQLQVKYSKIH